MNARRIARFGPVVVLACLALGCDKKSHGPLPANPKQPDPPQSICTQPDYKNCPPR